jgi:hypothetical protein
MHCTYCGDRYGEAMDHVIPYSHTTDVLKRKTVTRDKCVPSCAECNSILGSKMLYTVGRRAGYLAARYKKRYAKILDMSPWTKEELDELGYGLRHAIELSTDTRADVLMRVDHCKMVEAISPSIKDVWEQYD